MTSFQVRQATIGDLKQLVPLFDAYRIFYGRPSDPALARDFLFERFKHQESIIFLASAPGDPAVGFTQLFPSFSSLRAERIYILNDLFVLPSARRQGVAALLLEAAADFGRATGAVRLSLATALDNRPAQQLYERLGWQPDDSFRHYDLTL